MKSMGRSLSLTGLTVRNRTSELVQVKGSTLDRLCVVQTNNRKAESKDSTQKRAHSVAAQVLGKAAPTSASPSFIVLKVSVTNEDVDVRLSVSAQGAKPDGIGLPAVCRKGSTSVAQFSAVQRSNTGRSGSIEIGSGDVPTQLFSISSNMEPSWVGAKGHRKHTVLYSEKWDWKGNGDKPTEGQAADIEFKGPAFLSITLRKQTLMELPRCLQAQALREAMEGQDFDTLRAQLTKARMASVDAVQLAAGETRLKELKQLGLHVGEGCDKATVRSTMNWLLVTSKVGTPNVNKECSICHDCPCNVDRNPGETLEIVENDVQSILKGFGDNSDKLLFNALVESALAAEEGCIWKAGGKYLFTVFNRNQSAVALERFLMTLGQQDCAKMMMELHQYTERRYNGYVSAIQINFHPNHGSFHDQHRDVYSIKQSVGPNCTCKFEECVGTVCYSLGSSRLCLCETMTDEMSSIDKCSENCTGRKEYAWLHSGTSMYFDEAWNNNHTHGIPPCDENSGPRISIAFLLAAKPTACAFIRKA